MNGIRAQRALSLPRLNPLDASLRKSKSGDNDVTVSAVLFCFAIVLYTVSQTLYSSGFSVFDNNGTVYTMLRNASIVLLVYKTLVFTEWRIKEVVLALLAVAIVLMGAIASGSTNLLITYLFIVGAKDVSFRTCCMWLLVCLAVCIGAVVIANEFGVIQGRVLIELNALTGEIVERNALGFNHQNFTGRFILVAFLCYSCLRYDGYSLADYCVGAITAGILFFICSSKTSAIVTGIVVVLIWMSKRLGLRSFARVGTSIIIISCVLGLLLPYLYGFGLPGLSQLDDLLTTRLSRAHTYVSVYPVTIFGQNIALGEDAQVFGTWNGILDNAYINLLLRYGVVSLVGVTVSYCYIFRKSILNNDRALLVMVPAMFLIGVVETWFFTFFGCFTLVALAATGSKFAVGLRCRR